MPRTNPRAVDGEIWRRAVIEIDKMDRSVVSGLQHLLTLEGFSVEASGRRTQATYAALSKFYSSYWQRCLADEPLSSSCTSWRTSRRYDADADYPIEPIGLLIEVNEFNKAKTARASAPIDIVAPEWSRLIQPEFPERAQSSGITAGSATVRCKAERSGALSDCTVIAEAPSDAGFGQAVLRASRSGRLSPKTVDNTPEGSTVTFTTNFRLD
ncbi:Gram-negative bacterial tonB protein [compost metagenome]